MNKDNIILIDNDIDKELNYFNSSFNKDITIKDNFSLTIDYFKNINEDNNEINIYIGNNSSLVFNHSYINNNNYNLKININYTGEKSSVLVNIRGVNDGGISKVDIDGTLLNNNISNILDEKIKIINTNNGKVICKPNMYIKTSEIIANHENAIGNINKNEVFYLMSKGISRDNAEKLIINGYLLSIINNEDLKCKIREYLDSRR